MATNKQISEAARRFETAADQLGSLKDAKQSLQDKLANINAQINDMQTEVATLLADLKAKVNE